MHKTGRRDDLPPDRTIRSQMTKPAKAAGPPSIYFSRFHPHTHSRPHHSRPLANRTHRHIQSMLSRQVPLVPTLSHPFRPQPPMKHKPQEPPTPTPTLEPTLAPTNVANRTSHKNNQQKHIPPALTLDRRHTPNQIERHRAIGKAPRQIPA